MRYQPKDSKLCFFTKSMRKRITASETAKATIMPMISTPHSALLGTMPRSNCLLRIDEGPCELKAGDVVDVVRVDLPEGTVL